MSRLLSRLATVSSALHGLETLASSQFLNPRRASCLISNLYLEEWNDYVSVYILLTVCASIKCTTATR